MTQTAAERREHARKANRHRQLAEPSGTAMTAAARRAAEDRFTRQVRREHPRASERDIQRMAEAARGLFFGQLSAAGVSARRARADARQPRPQQAAVPDALAV